MFGDSQLCSGDVQSRYQPDKLKMIGLVGGDSFSVASGQHHTVVCCHGDVLTCGWNEYGRLELGPDRATPTQIQSLKGVKITSVEVGGSCSFAVMATGYLYSWGMGTNLQLGSGEEDDVWTPAKVSGKKIENRKILSVSARWCRKVTIFLLFMDMCMFQFNINFTVYIITLQLEIELK